MIITILKHYKIGIIAVLAIALCFCLVHIQSMKAEHAEYKQSIAEQQSKQTLQIIALERTLTSTNNEIDETLQNQKTKLQDNYESTIAKLNTKLDRMQQSNSTTTTTSTPSPSTSISYAASGAYISKQDIENIFVIASEADEVVLQLQACQKVISNYQSFNLYDQIEN